VQFSERKNFKLQEDKIRLVFDSLTQLEHPNIVKFHRYWTDTHNDKPRVIFITEYMSSGSLKHFLKRTKRNLKKLPLQSWKRWCTQILSALSYLHSCSSPIVHGNLTCDTIFIQHNGLVCTVCFTLFVINVHEGWMCLPRIHYENNARLLKSINILFASILGGTAGTRRLEAAHAIWP